MSVNYPTTNLNNYDYIISINFQNNQNIEMNYFFNTKIFNAKTYKKTKGNPVVNLINVNNATNFMLNMTLLNTLFFQNSSFLSSNMENIINNPVYSTFISSGGTQLSYRLLEIAAMKIFGHAGARAAIANDTDYYININTANSLLNQIVNSMQNTLYDVNVKQGIINEYCILNQFINTQYISAGIYNFYNTTWLFPIYFSPLLIIPNNTILLNGPNIGGNQLINGNLNIPILLRFVSNR